MTRMNINKDLIMTNKKPITFLFILVAVLIICNSFLNKINPASSILENEENTINNLVINEIMTSNKGVYNDPEGNSFDWIELYNGTNEVVDLTNYGLSDKENGEVKWIFPSVQINPKSYMIIYLADETRSGLYTNFSLKQEGGELITLKGASGKVIDCVRTIATNKNNSMFKNSTGEWLQTEEITPGFENSEQGRKEFLSSFKSLDAPSPIILSEFLPANKGNVIFNDNKLYSYIEVTNNSDDPVQLSDYYLSNDIKTPFYWRFPDTILQPGQSYLVLTNELSYDNNASFRLKKKTGSVVLSNRTNVIEEVKYEELSNGIAYIKENDIWRVGSNISPGYPNTTQGNIDFGNNIDFMKQELVISEAMSSNNRFLPQNGNQYYDWVELYNNTDQPINLRDYTLSTDYDDNRMFQLPDIVLDAHQFYILMASGNTSLSNSSYVHTNFKISSTTSLYLFRNTELIDSMFVYNIPRGNSYGRGTTGHFYYQNPTPGWGNDVNGLRQISYNPTFNVEGGVYNGISSLEIQIDGAGSIFYTTDGSIPSNYSTPYTGPLYLDRTTTIRAVSYEDNKQNSEVITNSYIINENHTVPVMSITLNRGDFGRINASTYGHNTVKAHAELFENNSSFSLDCGIKLFGGQSRELAKKSYALKFNSEYSGTQLHYKVFDNKEIYEFNTLVLRSGSQDQEKTLFRDEIISTMELNYGNIDVQAAKPIVLYINGSYWGVYFIREKIDDDFIEKNYNVNGPTSIVDYKLVTEIGSNYSVQRITNYIRSHNAADTETYNYISSILDIDNYVEYWASEMYIGNTDLHNTRYYSNNNVNGGRVRMIMYDTDFSFNYQLSDYINYIKYPSLLKAPPDTTIINWVFANPQAKQIFLEKASYVVKNVWTEQHINDTYYYFYNAVKNEMPRECARWGRSYDDWNRNAEELRQKMINKRSTVINIVRNYYGLTQEEVNGYFQ